MLDEEVKMTILGEQERNLLKNKSPFILPDNPSEKGFNANQIKRTMYEPILLLFDWLKKQGLETADIVELLKENINGLENDNIVLESKIHERATKLELDNLNGIIKLIGKDKSGNDIELSSIDLPTEKIIKNVYYDSATSELVFQFENANDVRVPIGDIFELDNYYTKTDTDNLFNNQQIQIDNIILKNTQQQELIDNLEYENSRLTKQVKNLQASAEGSTFVYEEDSGVAYEKDVPSGASPYAVVNKVGGMSYVVDKEIRNSVVTNIVSQGQNLFNLKNETRSELGYSIRCLNGEMYFTGQAKSIGNIDMYFDKPLPAGTYSLSLFNNVENTNFKKINFGFITSSLVNNYQYKLISKENDTYTITTTDKILGIFLGIEEISLDLTQLTCYPMVVKGLTPANEFRNYKSINKQLPSALLNLTDIGMGVQWLDTSNGKTIIYSNYVDLENKKYIRQCSSFYLDGSTGISEPTINDTTGFYRYGVQFTKDIALKSLNSTNSKMLQNSGIPNYTKYPDYAGNKYEQMAIQNYNVFIVISKDKASTREEMKTWLQNNPISGVYALDIPIEEDISELLKDIDEFIEVEELGSITFENEYEQDVSSTITYQVKVV